MSLQVNKERKDYLKVRHENTLYLFNLTMIINTGTAAPETECYPQETQFAPSFATDTACEGHVTIQLSHKSKDVGTRDVYY
ncbi:UNVERIFIED_CONTAM: hypothetical protein FKN15_061964 [Acipenser sinensis]